MMFRFVSPALVFVVLGSVSLSGCSWFDFGKDDKPPLAGTRISVLELQKNQGVAPTKPTSPLVIPAAWSNEYWPQSGGYPNHSLQNLALSP
ncbi:MAG: pyrrolo-quinoline quinone, partial [Alphaproteobacteria bacterium]|nr:pyrrolo-quinoline quinone [Alphaproteobacteria bacterium]